MFEPKNRLQAVGIFLAGCAVIAWTITDIERVSRQNKPLTPEQLKQLKDLGTEHRQQAASNDTYLFYFNYFYKDILHGISAYFKLTF